MIRKTYGVSGLMDWTTQIKAGKGSVSVHFTGGALTAYGVTPAKYSTSNLFFQNVIENSEQFKNGRIELLSTMKVPDDAATKARKERMAARVAQKAVKEVQDADTTDAPAPVKDASVDEGKPTKETHQGEQKQAADSDTDNDADGDADSEADYNKVKVADKNEAIEYLKEHFADKGYTATSLRTKTAFEAACKDCGVEFVFTA